MKKIYSVILLSILILAAIFTLVACDNSTSIEGWYVDVDDTSSNPHVLHIYKVNGELAYAQGYPTKSSVTQLYGGKFKIKGNVYTWVETYGSTEKVSEILTLNTSGEVQTITVTFPDSNTTHTYKFFANADTSLSDVKNILQNDTTK